MTARPLISDLTLAKLRQAVARLLANGSDVVLRRGATTLAAQRIVLAPTGSAGSSQGRRASGEAGREQRGTMALWGATTLDIQVDDRLTVASVLYRVVFVRPDRRVATIADLEVVE